MFLIIFIAILQDISVLDVDVLIPDPEQASDFNDNDTDHKEIVESEEITCNSKQTERTRKSDDTALVASPSKNN